MWPCRLIQPLAHSTWKFTFGWCQCPVWVSYALSLSQNESFLILLPNHGTLPESLPISGIISQHQISGDAGPDRTQRERGEKLKSRQEVAIAFCKHPCRQQHAPILPEKLQKYLLPFFSYWSVIVEDKGMVIPSPSYSQAHAPRLRLVTAAA